MISLLFCANNITSSLLLFCPDHSAPSALLRQKIFPFLGNLFLSRFVIPGFVVVRGINLAATPFPFFPILFEVHTHIRPGFFTRSHMGNSALYQTNDFGPPPFLLGFCKKIKNGDSSYIQEYEKELKATNASR